MERFDAIVVGAGPAGSTAAYRLARAGVRVLLLDRASFPRDKPCGGGLTRRAVRLLPFSVEPVVEDRVTCFEVGLGYRRRFERHSETPLVLMTQRRRLDAFLAEQAAAAGAEFRPGTKVEAVDGRSVRVDGKAIAADALIGADGVNGITARSLGLDGGNDHGVALEGNLPYGDAPEDRFRGRLVAELGIVPGGYGWVFAKADHVNVGVGGWLREGPRLRAHLSRLCRHYRLPEDRLQDVRGYRLPFRRSGSPLARGRVLLVGDAAGLVDPLSGDGIYEAFLSAKLGADAVLDLLAGRASSLEPYAGALLRSLSPHVAASWSAKLALDRFPRLTFALGRTPIAWKTVQTLLEAELPSPRATRGLRRATLRALDALAFAAGDPGRPYRLELRQL